MIRFLAVTVFASLLATSAVHATVSFADCSAVASEMNKNFPQRVDKLTSINGTTCLSGSERPVLQYNMGLDMSKAEVPPNAIDSLKARILQGWCTDPNQSKLLKDVDIKYAYYDRSGAYVGEVMFGIENCPR
jgi:hypothetical protein